MGIDRRRVDPSSEATVIWTAWILKTHLPISTTRNYMQILKRREFKGNTNPRGHLKKRRPPPSQSLYICKTLVFYHSVKNTSLAKLGNRPELQSNKESLTGYRSPAGPIHNLVVWIIVDTTYSISFPSFILALVYSYMHAHQVKLYLLSETPHRYCGEENEEPWFASPV